MMRVGSDAGAGRELCQVDEVTATNQSPAIDNASEADQPFTTVGLGLNQLDVIEVATIEERIRGHRSSTGRRQSIEGKLLVGARQG
jgi:hypothetical protein